MSVGDEVIEENLDKGLKVLQFQKRSHFIFTHTSLTHSCCKHAIH